MRILLLSEDSLRLEAAAGPMTIEAPSADTVYSPFHMLGSGLASCTWSVLASWARQAELDVADLAIEVRWSHSEELHRIGGYEVLVTWPSLPHARRQAAARAAATCSAHRTLAHETPVSVEVREPSP